MRGAATVHFAGAMPVIRPANSLQMAPLSSGGYVDEFDDITKPFDESDVTFVVGGRRLYFVRSKLTSQSPVFNAMLLGAYKEANLDSEIPLHEVDFDSFHAFLLVLAPSPYRQNVITEGNVLTMLEIADMYETYAVVERCGSFILLHWKDNPMKHLKAVELAATYRMPEVARVFLPMAVCRPVAEIDASSANLPSEIYAAILHGKLMKVCSTADHTRAYCPQPCNKYFKDCACAKYAPTNDPVIERALKRLGQRP